MNDRQVELVIFLGDEITQRIPLLEKTLVFGRSEDCDLCLADISVSRKHGQITLTGDEVLFEDLGSGNGSWFKGQRIRSQLLEDGDEVLIEPFRIRVEYTSHEETATQAVVEGTDRTMILQASDAELLLDPDYPEARLETVSGEVQPTTVKLEGALISLGRSEQRDLVLKDKAASRLHCEIVPLKGSYWLRDSGSANGVQVNGQAISEHELSDGDIICIGETTFRFLSDEPRGPTTDVLEIEQSEPGDGSDHTEAFVNVMAPDQGWSGAAPKETPEAQEQHPFEAPPAFPDLKNVDPDATIEPHDPSAPPIFAPLPTTPTPPPENQSAVDYGIGPDLGEAPDADWAFGGAQQVDSKGRIVARKAPGSGIFGNPIRVLIVLLMVFILSSIGFKAINDSGLLDGSDASTRKHSRQEAQKAEEESWARIGLQRKNDVEDEEELGDDQFEAQEFVDAYAAYKAGWNLINNTQYQYALRFKLNALMRKQWESAERITISKLKLSVQAKQATGAEREQALEKALTAGRKALKKNSVRLCQAAQKDVEKALMFNPGNTELESLRSKLQSRVGSLRKKITVRNEEKVGSKMDTMIADGKSNLSRGQYKAAIRSFQNAIDLDPNRANIGRIQEAEDGLREAKAIQQRKANEYYKKATPFFDSSQTQDLIQARDLLRDARKIDRDIPRVNNKYESVMNKLRKKAKDQHFKAKNMAKIGQNDRARSLYFEVLSLLDDPKEQWSKEAQKELNQLGE